MISENRKKAGAKTSAFFTPAFKNLLKNLLKNQQQIY
jgi:hypothetical protein